MCVTAVTLVTGAWLSTAARESTSLARSVSYEGRTITAGTCQLGRSAPVTATTCMACSLIQPGLLPGASAEAETVSWAMSNATKKFAINCNPGPAAKPPPYSGA